MTTAEVIMKRMECHIRRSISNMLARAVPPKNVFIFGYIAFSGWSLVTYRRETRDTNRAEKVRVKAGPSYKKRTRVK